MVFADLPYGVTANKWDTPIDLPRLWASLLSLAKPNAAFVFTATQPFATTLINSQPKMFRYDLIWRKSRPVGFLDANRRPLRSHEHVLVFAKSSTLYTPQKSAPNGKPKRVVRAANRNVNYGAHKATETIDDGSRFPTSVLDIAVATETTHPTQKPVALLEWLIKTYTNEGDTVLDPVMGSGTTAVACINTGRNFVGVEKDGVYFTTAAKRIGEALST